jgi:hypothetical protein
MSRIVMVNFMYQFSRTKDRAVFPNVSVRVLLEETDIELMGQEQRTCPH